MESYFASLYLDLQERIKSQVPEIEWIEQDFGQDVFDKWRPNVAFPAVLIDFPDTTYDYLSDNALSATASVTLRLLVAPFEQSNDDAPIEVKQMALQFFELEYKLSNAIHGWMPNDDYSQPLVLNKVSSNNRNDLGLRIRELHFTTAFYLFDQ